MNLGKSKHEVVHNLRKFGIFHRHLLRDNIHTQFVTQNVKMTFSVQPTHAPLNTSGVRKYFFCCKTSNVGNRYHRKQCNCKRPNYYTMITLFDENRKYYNQNTKLLYLVSRITLQATLLIGTTEPLNSVPGNSDGIRYF